MKRLLSGTSPLNTDLAALLLRLIFGGLFIYHGYSKILTYDQYLPLFPDLIHIGGKLSFQLVIFAEFIGGIFIVLGLFTRFAVIPIFIVMLVAYFIAHAKNIFLEKELPFLFLVLCLVVFVLGSGKYSLDRLRSRSK